MRLTKHTLIENKIITKGTQVIIMESWRYLIPWQERSVEEKIRAMQVDPYHSDKFYHVTSIEALKDIERNGISGEEIWVTKGKPHPEYTNGILIELDLDGVELRKDQRWSDHHNVSIVHGHISNDRITRVFDWLDEIGMREDELAYMISNRNMSDEEVKEILDSQGLLT